MKSLKRTRPARSSHLPQPQLLFVVVLAVGFATGSSATTASSSSCSLACVNGGTCHTNNNGDLDIQIYDDAATLDSEIPPFDDMASVLTNHGHYEHSSTTITTTTTTTTTTNPPPEEVCVCPLGFTGPSCEIVLKPCTHFKSRKCWNGQTCVQQPSLAFPPQSPYYAANGEEHHVISTEQAQTPFYHCECDSEKSNFGLEPSSQQRYCTQTLLRQSCTFHSSSSTTKNYYCYNGGKCGSSPLKEECICAEGWKGTHCQYTPDQLPQHLQSMDTQGRTDDSQRRFPSIIIIMGVVFISLVVFVVGGAVYYYHYYEDGDDSNGDTNPPSFPVTTTANRMNNPTATTTAELELADLQHTLDADGSSTMRRHHHHHHYPKDAVAVVAPPLPPNNNNIPLPPHINNTPRTAEIVRTSSIV